MAAAAATGHRTTTTTTAGADDYWGEEAWGRRLSCPITCQLFTDPVMASDGFLYERGPIERWFQRHGTSPMNRERLDGVFHGVPTVRAEVDAFLNSMDLERRRRWRRWARSPAFQALVDWLESALGAAAARQPVAWRRLQHESAADWTAWLRAAEALPRTAPRRRRRARAGGALDDYEEESGGGGGGGGKDGGGGEDGGGGMMEPEGAPAAQLGRLHGWSEEAMADVWHRLPDLASMVGEAGADGGGGGGGGDGPRLAESDDAAWTRAGLVCRATQRLLAYLRVTCAGYMMAGPTVARCAEAGAWAAATAVVRHAPRLDTNLLVRTLAASFADSRPGWSLIAEVCKRAMAELPAAPPFPRSSVVAAADDDGGGDNAAAAAAATFADDASAASSSREATFAVGEEEDEDNDDDDDVVSDDSGGGGDEEEDWSGGGGGGDEEEDWSGGGGGGLDVIRENEDEEGGHVVVAASTAAAVVAPPFPPVVVHQQQQQQSILPTVLGVRPRARSTARAEEAAFAEAMAYVDRNGAGLFEGGDADFDDRRRRRRW